MNAFERLKDILQALNDEQVDYVLFGGQAVNLHGILRFTEDIDLFVSPTMKRPTVRPIDRADALDLKAKFNIVDE